MEFKYLKEFFSWKKKTRVKDTDLLDDTTFSNEELDPGLLKQLETQGKELEERGFEEFSHSQYEEAISFWKEGLSCYHKVKSIPSMACMYTNIGTAYRYQGEFHEALRHYRKAVELDKKTGNKKGVIEGLLNIGSALRYLGEFSEALKFFQEGYNDTKYIENLPMMGLFLESTGYCLLEQTKYDNAIDSFHQVIKIAGKVKDISLHTDGLRGLTEVYIATAEYDSLLEILSELTEVLSKPITHDLQLRILFNLLNAYTHLGFKKESGEIFDRITNDQQIRDLPSSYLSSYFLALGKYYLAFGNYSEGIELVHNAVEIGQNEKNMKKLAMCYHLMACLMLYAGRINPGIEYAKKSIQLSMNLKDKVLETSNLIILSKLANEQNHLSELSRFASSTLSKCVPLARPELTWQAHYCMALAFHLKKDHKKSFRQYYNAIKLLDDIVSKIPHVEKQKEYLVSPERINLFKNMVLLVKIFNKKSDIDNVLKEIRTSSIYETLTKHLSNA